MHSSLECIGIFVSKGVNISTAYDIDVAGAPKLWHGYCYFEVRAQQRIGLTQSVIVINILYICMHIFVYL